MLSYRGQLAEHSSSPLPTNLNTDSMSKDTRVIKNKNYPCGKYWL